VQKTYFKPVTLVSLSSLGSLMVEPVTVNYKDVGSTPALSGKKFLYGFILVKNSLITPYKVI
jgi:hypothetical protein